MASTEQQHATQSTDKYEAWSEYGTRAFKNFCAERLKQIDQEFGVEGMYFSLIGYHESNHQLDVIVSSGKTTDVLAAIKRLMTTDEKRAVKPQVSAEQQRDQLLAALEGVVRVADRKTDEFDAAHAAIAAVRAAKFQSAAEHQAAKVDAALGKCGGKPCPCPHCGVDGTCDFCVEFGRPHWPQGGAQ